MTQDRQTLADPRKAYYTGRFPEQQQPYPGVQSKMEPVPDCGETSYRGTGRLKGRKALVTGGDSGIGRAAAIAYAREGADVAIAYMPDEESDAQEVRRLIEAEGRRAVLLPGDLSEEAYARALVREAAQALDGLDILALVAGKQVATRSMDEISTQQLEAVFRINVFSIFWMLKEAKQVMPQGGAIILTSSKQAYEPSASLMDYAATKGAIKNLTQSLAQEFAGLGIRVNGVAPGPIWTALQVSGGQLSENLPEFGHDTPLQRAGQPVELAGVYVFLASPESSYVSASTYSVGGGLPFE